MVNLTVIDDLASDSLASIDEINMLFTVEKANAQICATSAPALLDDLERISVQAPAANGVIVMRSGGGFGNELNTVMKAILVGITLNRTVCAHEMNTRTMAFLASPVTVAFDKSRRPACAAMTKNIMHFTSVNSVPTNKDVALDTGSWSGKKDRGFEAFGNLALTYGADYNMILSCLSNALFRPNEEVRRFIAPYLRYFREADFLLGAHIRSGDFAMASYQGYSGGRLLSLGRHRRGSISEIELSRKIMRNLPLKCFMAETTPVHSAVVFIGSDRVTNMSVWQTFAPLLTVMRTPGHPVHTGRSAVAVSERGGALKAVADFFLLTEVDWFVSNVNYMATVGNTYARNVHQRRSPGREYFERVGPTYDCLYYLNRTPIQLVGS